jgi:hypothetical protein
VILESESWRFISSVVHIGLHLKNSPPKEYTVKLTEMKDSDMLPQELRFRYELFNRYFDHSDAFQVSQKDRVSHNVCDKIEFTYGEVLFQYFIPLFALTQPKEGETFWDIGCGAGRPLAIASMNFP